MKMLRNLRTVNAWYKTPSTNNPAISALEQALRNGTGSGSPVTYFFTDIYVPVRKRDTTTHAFIEPAEFDYINVGMTPEQLADLYWTEYGRNMLSVPMYDDDVPGVVDSATLGKKMRAILLKNQYKYLKWIEEMGYAYNPLWTVKGDEIVQELRNEGGVQRNVKPILATSQALQTNSYEGALKDTQKTTTTYNATDGTVVGLIATSEEKHENAKNKVNGEDADYTVAAADTAFGTALTGGDYMRVEKRIKNEDNGHITADLLEAERDRVRFNVIQEFFDDVNDQLLVGVFPEY